MIPFHCLADMASACLCPPSVQWTQCAHKHCAVVRQQWMQYLEHDHSSGQDCCAFMEQIQRHVQNCSFGESCPVRRLPGFAAAPQPEGSSPVSSGQMTPRNDSGCSRIGRSSASNLSVGQMQPSAVVPPAMHPSAVGEMNSFNSDDTFHTPFSSGHFLIPPPSISSSYYTAPSSLGTLSRQNSDRPTSLQRSLTPIGEENSRAAADAAFQSVQDSLSHPVQLLPDVEESVKSINQLAHFGTTPLPSPFPEQEIVHPLNPVSAA